MLCEKVEHISTCLTAVHSALTNGQFDAANEDKGLSRAVQKFWNIKQLGITDTATETNDERAMQMYSDTVKLKGWAV